MVEGDSLQYLDRPHRRGGDLVFYLAQEYPRLYPDGLQVGRWQERAEPEEG